MKLYFLFIWGILILFYSSVSFAQIQIGFTSQPSCSKIFDGCVENWNLGNGNAIYSNNKISIEDNSTVFLNYQFEKCKYYRVSFSIDDIKKNDSLNVFVSNELINSNQKATQHVNNKVIVKGEKLNELIVFDSLLFDVAYNQFAISSESELSISNFIVQPIFIDSLLINQQLSNINALISGNKLVFKDNLLNNNEYLQLQAQTYIDIQTGVDLKPGAKFEAIIKPLAVNNNECEQFENSDGLINIFNLVTQNKDGKNDNWVITNISNFKNKVQVFSRLGELIFEQSNYNNQWEAENIPKGNYLYRVELLDKDKVYTGILVIN